jgi:hypothetical protein
MESQRKDPQRIEDYELVQALERDEDLGGLSIHHQRLARIHEYEELSLARSEPCAALLGMGTSHFAKLFELLGKAVLDDLESQTPSLSALREVGPEIRLLLKIRSAIEADFAFQQEVIGEQAMALPRATRNGALDKRPFRFQRGVVPRHPRPND